LTKTMGHARINSRTTGFMPTGWVSFEFWPLTVFYKHVRNIPKDERHRPARPGHCLLIIIPGIAVPIYPSGSIAIDMDAISSYNKTGMMILECNRVRIVAPIVKIIRHLTER